MARKKTKKGRRLLTPKKLGGGKTTKKRRRLRTPKKLGGIIPILPILGALGMLATGASSVATAVTSAQARKKKLEETQRHNKAMEAKGGGIWRKRRRGRGLQLYPWSPATPWLSSQSKKIFPRRYI